MQVYEPSYDFGLLGDTSTDPFYNELSLDSPSHSFSAFSSEPSSPDSMTSSECVSPYDMVYLPPNPESITIAVQPEFGQVQSVVPQQYLDIRQPSNPFVQQDSSRGEKRKRDGEELSAFLPKDVLLKISSKEYEETIRNIERQRPLTQAEQTEVQRQRKKVRNREYAQNCRSKKKQILESAQDENDRLKQEKTEIHNALIETQKDNQRLLYENMHMKMILSSLGYTFNSTTMLPPASLQMGQFNPNLFPTTPNVTSRPGSPPVSASPSPDHGMTTINLGAADPPSFFPANYNPTPLQPCITKKPQISSHFAPQNPFTTICLFAIIFSFGFFFGGSFGPIPGLTSTDKLLVVESRGRSLFESTDPEVPIDVSTEPQIPSAPDISLKPNCTEAEALGIPCEPKASEDDAVVKEL